MSTHKAERHAEWRSCTWPSGTLDAGVECFRRWIPGGWLYLRAVAGRAYQEYTLQHTRSGQVDKSEVQAVMAVLDQRVAAGLRCGARET